MDFKVKIAIVAAFLVCVVAGLIGASYIFASNAGNAANATQSDSFSGTFREADFNYGPQTWVPYASPLPVVPGSDVNGNNSFKLMFVDLNVSSRQGGSNNNPIVVEYAFENLAGTAAFHGYGYNQASTNGGGIAWTNRADGSGSSGFYVSGNPGSPLSMGGSIIDNHAYVQVANSAGPAYDDYGNGTYYLNFNKPGGGLNALRLSTSYNSSGDVAFTASQTGTFYVTAASDNGFDTVLLLVAVNSTQPADFDVKITAYPYADQP